MDFYFSGVESKAELEMLREAGVSRLLLDPTQIAKLDRELDGFRLALDSGAYRDWKNRIESNVSYYSTIVEGLERQGYKFDFVTSMDAIGDPATSYRNWLDLAIMETFALPLWHYGEDQEWLDRYLAVPDFTDWAADELCLMTGEPHVWNGDPGDCICMSCGRDIDDSDQAFWNLTNRYERITEIGIGGLVPFLFTDADKDEKKRCREEITVLCEEHPNRFRLFGACDLPLLNAVKDTALSADSSFWIRGRRRGAGFYVNRKTGQLCEAAPWLMKKLAPDYPEIAELLEMDGRARSIANARALERYFNQG